MPWTSRSKPANSMPCNDTPTRPAGRMGGLSTRKPSSSRSSSSSPTGTLEATPFSRGCGYRRSGRAARTRRARGAASSRPPEARRSRRSRSRAAPRPSPRPACREPPCVRSFCRWARQSPPPRWRVLTSNPAPATAQPADLADTADGGHVGSPLSPSSNGGSCGYGGKRSSRFSSQNQLRARLKRRILRIRRMVLISVLLYQLWVRVRRRILRIRRLAVISVLPSGPAAGAAQTADLADTADGAHLGSPSHGQAPWRVRRRFLRTWQMKKTLGIWFPPSFLTDPLSVTVASVKRLTEGPLTWR